MLPRHSYVTRISDSLTLLSSIVKTRSNNSLNDASHLLETIVRLFFNNLYGWELVNLNTLTKDYPAADLADPTVGVAVQVTVQDKSRKIADTVEKATKHGLPAGVDRLLLFFFVQKAPGLPKTLSIPDHFGLEILDIPRVVAEVSEIDDLGKLQHLSTLLDDEIGSYDSSTKIASTETVAEPKLIARFQEYEGELCTNSKKLPSYAMDLWVKDPPESTDRVAFEILDEGTDDRIWTVRKKEKASVRKFVTDDLNLYGDVEIWALGTCSDGTEWRVKSSLYEALARHYGNRPTRKDIRTALRQIKDN